MNIELRTPMGTKIRISGNLTGRELQNIIIASSTLVYPGAGSPLLVVKRADGQMEELPFAERPGAEQDQWRSDER